MSLVAIDTETSGLDLYHGCQPYLVTAAFEGGDIRYWEWPVDPLTRRPSPSAADLEEIANLVTKGGHRLVLHNAKFDITALNTIIPWLADCWPWHRTEDTLVAAHLLASKQKHNLTDMATQYLGVDIQPFENALHEACEKARRLCRRHLPAWAIAAQGRPDMPSAKEKCWKADGWLLRALCRWAAQQKEVYVHPRPRKVRGKWKEAELPWWWDYSHTGHPWLTMLSDYANADSAVTLGLWQRCEKEIQSRRLGKIYRERMKLPAIALDIEARGVTINRARLEELRGLYQRESNQAAAAIQRVASRLGVQDLVLPKGGNNQSLHSFCYETLGLPVIGRTEKTGKPSLDKATFAEWEATITDKGTPQGLFVNALKHKRKRDTGASYLNGYERFWLPLNGKGVMCSEEMRGLREVSPDKQSMSGGNVDLGWRHWYVLHPNLNQTGTDTLRWSSSQPNSQNIEKEEVSGTSLRSVFGPAPGREWWSCDGQNLELRIPAFKAPEPLLIDVFNRPNDPPYYGSYHLAVFDVLHPELFAKHGKECKDIYAASWYQWVKNFNFALIYGCQEEKADRTAHVKGAYRKVYERFPGIARLSRQQIALAERDWRIWTIPDVSVDPDRGYPLDCTRTEWGGVLPTVPLNYYVSGSACWWMARAMVRCHGQLRHWGRTDDFDGRITLQVHDELVFDLPAGKGCPREDALRERGGVKLDRHNSKSNLWRVRLLQRLMRQGGDDLGVPTPVSCKYHRDHWGEGVTL